MITSATPAPSALDTRHRYRYLAPAPHSTRRCTYALPLRVRYYYLLFTVYLPFFFLPFLPVLFLGSVSFLFHPTVLPSVLLGLGPEFWLFPPYITPPFSFFLFYHASVSSTVLHIPLPPIAPPRQYQHHRRPSHCIASYDPSMHDSVSPPHTHPTPHVPGPPPPCSGVYVLIVTPDNLDGRAGGLFLFFSSFPLLLRSSFPPYESFLPPSLIHAGLSSPPLFFFLHTACCPGCATAV